jgi:exodeoxyribonuclease VIII
VEINPGIYYDIPFSEYLKIDAFNQSGSKYLLRSPAHYMAYMLSEEEKKADCLILGSLIDCLCLEPAKFDSYFAIRPDTYTGSKGETKPWNANSKTCKGELELLSASGKQVVSMYQFELAQNISSAVLRHKTATEILSRSKKQTSLIWNDTDTGILCKGRLDMLSDVDINDLKSTQDASPEGFSRSIDKFGYHIQGAFYSDGYAALTGNVQLPYNIIAVETIAPFCVATYALEPDTLLIGRDIYKKALKKFKDCKQHNNWPGYSDFVEPIDIPAYALKKGIENAENEGW